MATELRPDLVLLDVKMPVLDGLSAAEQIVAARIAPVVILTAFSQRDLVERAREAGVMAYLVKPFQKKDLLPAIEMAASRFAELVALEREVGDLTGRLEARKLVDRAKGRLQTEHGMSEPEAFRFLQRRSMDTRRSMRAVAQDVLDGARRRVRARDRAAGRRLTHALQRAATVKVTTWQRQRHDGVGRAPSAALSSG